MLLSQAKTCARGLRLVMSRQDREPSGDRLDAQEITRITERYAFAPAWDRFHVRHRLRFFPHDVLLPFLPEIGSVLDIGCGFALLGWYLAEHRPNLRYYGSDIDQRKIDLARAALERHLEHAKNIELYGGDARSWPGRPGKFTVVALLDVLLLLPMNLQREMFAFACSALETGSGAKVILKVQPMMRGIPYLRTLVQETIMVRILRKTKSSGALHLRQDPNVYAAWGREHGLSCREVEVPTYPPSTLLVLERTN